MINFRAGACSESSHKLSRRAPLQKKSQNTPASPDGTSGNDFPESPLAVWVLRPSYRTVGGHQPALAGRLPPRGIGAAKAQLCETRLAFPSESGRAAGFKTL